MVDRDSGDRKLERDVAYRKRFCPLDSSAIGKFHVINSESKNRAHVQAGGGSYRSVSRVLLPLFRLNLVCASNMILKCLKKQDDHNYPILLASLWRSCSIFPILPPRSPNRVSILSNRSSSTLNRCSVGESRSMAFSLGIQRIR